MSELRPQLLETAEKLLDRSADLAAFEAAGFGLILTPDMGGDIGGDMGADWGDVAGILSLVGYHHPDLELAKLMGVDGPLAVVAMSSGALQRCLDMSIDHANTRVQFGKPLGKRQAVQQNLAVLAEEVAAVTVAVQGASRARDVGSADFEIACAKLRTNQAIGVGVAIAHQVHGAIGFTQDYPLHRFTRALTLWRSLHGSEAHWAALLGDMAISFGGTDLWREIARRSDP